MNHIKKNYKSGFRALALLILRGSPLRFPQVPYKWGPLANPIPT
jgi:hypothetical protein